MKIKTLLSISLLAFLLTACAEPQRKNDPIPNSTPNVTPNSIPSNVPVEPPKSETQGIEDQLLEKHYEGFTLWLDCKERAAVKFRYNAQRDNGNEPREEKFTLDPDVPKDCQQKNGKTYGKKYDRGHQVPANHMDFSAAAIKQSNYMTNILPQAAGMNRGAWLLTEEITECYRDIDELLILGGVIWGDNTEDDYFVESHGVRTPDAFWKVIIRGKDEVIAWIIPNSQEAKRKNLDEYLTTVANIEEITGMKIPVTGDARTRKLKSSWLIPRGCKKG